MEHHPLDRNLGVQQLQQVPADRFPFAVFIRRKQQLIGHFEGVLELLTIFLVFGNHIERFKVFLGVDAGLGPLLSLVARGDLAGVVGEVAHMAHRCLHTEGARQEAADGAGLRGLSTMTRVLGTGGSSRRGVRIRRVDPSPHGRGLPSGLVRTGAARRWRHGPVLNAGAIAPEAAILIALVACLLADLAVKNSGAPGAPLCYAGLGVSLVCWLCSGRAHG